MHKLALTSAICLAALAFAGAARAEAPTIKIGKPGQFEVEFSQCGSILCAKVLRPEESASKRPCEAKSASDSKSGDKSIWEGLLSNKGSDSKSIGLPKLDAVAEAGSKLFGDGFPLKAGSSEAKNCEDAPKAAAVPAPTVKVAPPAPAMKTAAPAPAPSVKKAAPQPQLASKPDKAPAPKVAKTEPTTTPQPVREATKATVASPIEKGKAYDCRKYLSQIGETISVPCE